MLIKLSIELRSHFSFDGGGGNIASVIQYPNMRYAADSNVIILVHAQASPELYSSNVSSGCLN